MKEKKISAVMRPYIDTVLARDQIPVICISYPEDGSNYIHYHMDVSSIRFREVMEDALCLKQQAESASKRPVISLRTFKNKEKRERILNGSKAFHLLKADEELFLRIH